MQWTQAAEAFTALIPIFALLVPIVAIVGGIIQARHRESERHETIRILARSGQPIPPELLQRQRGHDHDEAPELSTRLGVYSQSSMRRGIILVSVGLGVCGCLYLLSPEGWLWGIGLIPLFLGLGFLLIAKLEAK